MPQYLQGDGEISDGVNLLISILVRYPEISTISFEPDTSSLKFNFLLSRHIDDSIFFNIRQVLLSSIKAYHMLEGLEQARSDIQLQRYGHDVAILTMLRDVATLSKGEFAIIISLLRENLKDCLLTDQNEGMLEEDLLVQEELIDNMLASVKQQENRQHLIGIREDGRVLVFNK